MADVFISYARSTAKIAKDAADALAKEGLSVWFDQDLPASRAYADVISERLDEAKAVLVLWSKEGVASHWVRSEADRARAKGKLVQASVDGSAPPMPFDQIQCADLSRWRGNPKAPGWRKLKSDIAELADAGRETAQPSDSEGSRFQRRHVLAGAGALAAAAAAGLYLVAKPRAYKPPPEAELLVQKAFAVMQDGRPAEQEQAIAYLTEATRLTPDYASAWGGLALTYALRKFQVPLPARAGEDARARSAAQATLAIEPDQPFATCALVLLTPTYRHWSGIERKGRELVDRIGKVPLVFHILGDVLMDVGRNRESLDVYAKIDRKRFLIPLSERSIIHAMWNAGQIQAAEGRLEEAVKRWPLHYAIWTLHTAFLTHSGRAAEALRKLEDRERWPVNYPEDQIAAAVATARAVAGTISAREAIQLNMASLEAGSAEVLSYLNRKVTMAQLVALRCAALGDSDSAFALLDGYYFGEGPWAKVAPAAGDMDRSTFTLFEPPMSRLWHDERFGALTRRIGLDAYWRQSGSTPDFRRA